MREHAIAKGAREHTLGISVKEEGWESLFGKVVSEERLEYGNGAGPVHIGERCFQLVGTESAKAQWRRTSELKDGEAGRGE